MSIKVLIDADGHARDRASMVEALPDGRPARGPGRADGIKVTR